MKEAPPEEGHLCSTSVQTKRDKPQRGGIVKWAQEHAAPNGAKPNHRALAGATNTSLLTELQRRRA